MYLMAPGNSDLYGERDKLGLSIVPGGHSDTQPLRVPAFSWFNRHLKGENGPITVAAESSSNRSNCRCLRNCRGRH